MLRALTIAFIVLASPFANPGFARADDPAPDPAQPASGPGDAEQPTRGSGPRWAAHGGLAFAVTPGAIFSLAAVQGTYLFPHGLRGGVLLQQSIHNNGGLEGCSTTDCSARQFDARLVGEMHGGPDDIVDPWVGLQMGPSIFTHGDWEPRENHVGMSAHAVLGLDFRIPDWAARPVIGVGVTAGWWTFEGEASSFLLPGLWCRGGIEF